MRQIDPWMGEHGLQLAIPKTEIVLLTRRRVSTNIDVNVDDGVNPHTIQTKTSVKYSGVLLDNKLNFGEHFQRSCERAASAPSSILLVKAHGQHRGAQTGEAKAVDVCSELRPAIRIGSLGGYEAGDRVFR